MYEKMLYWETAHTVPDQPAVARDFTQLWQAAGAASRRGDRAVGASHGTPR
jgi:hypothetical protein